MRKESTPRKGDEELIKRFVSACADQDMTLQQVADAVGKTKGWASLLVRGEVKTIRWQTANRIKRFLGEST